MINKRTYLNSRGAGSSLKLCNYLTNQLIKKTGMGK